MRGGDVAAIAVTRPPEERVGFSQRTGQGGAQGGWAPFFSFFVFLHGCFLVTLCPRSRQREVWLVCDAVSSVAAEVAPEAANRYQPCTNGALAEALQCVVCRLEQRTEGERVFCQPLWSSPGWSGSRRGMMPRTYWEGPLPI